MAFLSTHKKRQRSQKILSLFLIISGVLLFLGIMLRKNIRFFVTPTQVFEENLLHHKQLRLGGVVKEQSVVQKNLEVVFTLTDGSIDIPVHYSGILPDLFREGQTIVAIGHFEGEQDKTFLALEILAKHDENYRPPTLTRKDHA